MAKASYIQHLEMVTERAPASLVGSKARNMGSLLHAGFPVPDGFVVTTEALKEVMKRSGIGNSIATQLDGINDLDAEAQAARVEAIRRLFIEVSLPAIVEASIMRAYEELSGASPARVCVRSSPTESGGAEDGSDARFAGLYDFSLGVQGPEEVVEAVRGLWASIYSARAIEIRRQAKIDSSRVSMAVIVQRLMYANVSGVMFTCDPHTGDRQRIVINSFQGIGASRKEDGPTAEVFELDRSGFSIIERNCGQSGPSGITEEFSRALARLGIRVEEHFSAPQEIGWCLFEDRFYLLKARPVTPDTSDGLTVWSRANLGEVFPRIMTPFTWSVTRHYLEKANEKMYSDFGLKVPRQVESWATIRGRIYRNLSAFADMLKQVPLISLRRLPEFRGTPIELRMQSLPKPTIRRRLKLLSTSLNVLFSTILGNKRAAMALDHAAQHYERFLHSDLKSRSDAALYLLFDKGLNEVLPPIFAALHEATYKLNFLIATTHRLLSRHSRNATADLDWNLFSGVGGIKSAEAVVEIWKLGRLAMACELTDLIKSRRQYNDFTAAMMRAEGGDVFLKRLQIFLDEFGHRCFEELELARPRWIENTQELYRMIETTLDCREDADPALRFEKERATGAEAQKQAERSLPFWAKPLFRRLIRRTREAIVERERLRFSAIKCLRETRAVAVEAARRFVERKIIEHPSDVFYLTIQEVQQILGMLEFAGEPKQLVAERKRQHDELPAMPDPPPVIVGEEHSSDVDNSPVIYADDMEYLSGMAASSGTHSGPARILLDVEGCDRLRPGDIVIARDLDAAWTPVFAVAGAIITEVCDPLSEAAVIAREAGIPMVMSITNACASIEEEQLITVDGATGRVWLKPQVGFENISDL